MSKRIFEKYTNEHSRFIDINGTRIHYRDEGHGEPVLLLHGAFSSLHTFDDWTEELKNHFRILRVTMPGFGLTGPNKDNIYTIQGHMRVIHEFLDQMNINTCHIAGSSLGGWIAWEFALRYHQRVNKLILIDAAGFLDDQSIPMPFRMARTPFLNKVVKYAIRPQILRKYLNDVYVQKHRVTEELVDRYYELATLKGNPEAFLRMVNSKPKDNTALLHEIKVPTLIVWGEEDNWVPLQNAFKFKEMIPGSKLIVYKEMGHVPMEEVPHITAMDARSFLMHDWH